LMAGYVMVRLVSRGFELMISMSVCDQCTVVLDAVVITKVLP
jgi:hypothetical protein